MRLPVPELDHVCTLNVELDPIREMGPGRAGQRRIIPIVGGSVEGTRLSGRLLCLGADWQTVFADGLAELDTRYAMETRRRRGDRGRQLRVSPRTSRGDRCNRRGSGCGSRELLHANARSSRDGRRALRMGQPVAVCRRWRPQQIQRHGRSLRNPVARIPRNRE